MSKLTESTLIMVDDNIDEIFLTRRLVRRDGIVNRFVSERKPERIFQAFDELIDMGLKKESFVVLLDINMPRMNGFETLRAIRKNNEFGDIPIFMLSASKSKDEILEAEKLGCNGYLTKPFSGEQFFSILQNITSVKKKVLSCLNEKSQKLQSEYSNSFDSLTPRSQAA